MNLKKTPQKLPPTELTKMERTILSIISLTIGLGLAFALNFSAARLNLGGFWIRALITGVIGGIAYLYLDYRLFSQAAQNIKDARNKK